MDELKLYRTCEKFAKDMIKDKDLLNHTIRVVDRVSEFSNEDLYTKACMVAWLHDIIEDTPATCEDLYKQGIPADVVNAVDIITRRGGEDYKVYIQAIATNKLARIVKLSDLKDNIDITRLDKFGDYEMKRLRKYWLSYKFLIGDMSKEEYQTAK